MLLLMKERIEEKRKKKPNKTKQNKTKQKNETSYWIGNENSIVTMLNLD